MLDSGLELRSFESSGCDLLHHELQTMAAPQHVTVGEAGREELNEILNSAFALL